MTDFVKTLTAMNWLRALIATGLAERSGTMTAPDIEVIVSTNVSTLRFSTSP